MSFTYNITFAVAREREDELLDYIRNVLKLEILGPDSYVVKAELKKVIEAGGEKPDSDQALSMALAATFESEEKAHFWNDHILFPALESFHEKFGQHALFFVTLLQNLPL